MFTSRFSKVLMVCRGVTLWMSWPSDCKGTASASTSVESCKLIGSNIYTYRKSFFFISILYSLCTRSHLFSPAWSDNWMSHSTCLNTHLTSSVNVVHPVKRNIVLLLLWPDVTLFSAPGIWGGCSHPWPRHSTHWNIFCITDLYSMCCPVHRKVNGQSFSVGS